MLGKLIKYEIKATARIFLPLYLVLLVSSIVNRFTISLSTPTWKAPQVISMLLYILILVGMFIITFVMIIQRFYKNLLTDEGYLMFTLPIKPWKHIICKLLTSMMWILLSGIMAFISIFIIASGNIFTLTLTFRSLIAEIFVTLGPSAIFFLLEGFLIAAISLASYVLIIYASIAIGHLSNRHRIIASVGAYIGLTTLTQIILVIMGVIISRTPFYSNMGITDDINIITSAVHFSLWNLIAFFGIITAGYYTITNYILSKRLNLE